MNRFSSKLHEEEDGIALIVALGVLFIVAIIATGALANSVLFAGDSNRNAGSTRALSAAEAGLQQARYRLDKFLPAAANCFYMNNASTLPKPSGECPNDVANSTTGSPLDQTPTDTGNSASYRYWVTNAGQLTQCRGVVATGPQDRCIVSIGTVGNQQRRLAVLVTPPDLFPVGLLGTASVKVKNNIQNGAIGSDGSIDTGNSAPQFGCQVTYPGPYSGTDCGTPSGAGYVYVTPNCPYGPPFTFAVCQNGLNATRDYSGSQTTNINTTGVTPPTAYNNTGGTRTLTGDANGIATLAAGVYSFCQITARTIQIPAGAVVQIFLDSKARAGSTCPTQITEPIVFSNGDVTFNGVWAGNGTPVASNLQIFVYGVPGVASGSPGACLMGDGNGGQHTPTVRAALYAPNCDFIFDKANNAFWRGALVGQNIVFKNNLDFRDESSRDPINGGNASFYLRKLWMECKKTAPPSDPESGC